MKKLLRASLIFMLSLSILSCGAGRVGRCDSYRKYDCTKKVEKKEKFRSSSLILCRDKK